MPSIDHEELFILATDEPHGGFGLRQRTDVILFTCDIEDRACNIREVYAATAKRYFSLHEFVLLVKVPDPLPERLTGEWYTVIYPLAHCQPCVHRFTLHDAIPHCDIGTDVVGDGPDHAVARID